MRVRTFVRNLFTSHIMATAQSNAYVEKVLSLKKDLDTHQHSRNVGGVSLPKCRVQLHVHLDGSVRVSTLFEVMQRRGIDVGAKDIQTLRKKSIPIPGVSLVEYLKPFDLILRILGGDPAALRRIAREFVEDQASEGVAYVEVRYSPHLLRGAEPYLLTAEQVTDAIISGLEDGSKSIPDITVKSILCGIRNHPEWIMECVDLAATFRGRGAVAIDIAGDETAGTFQENQAAYLRAQELGIHRTAHAGESGPSEHVRQAMDLLHVERVGHGYAVVEDRPLLERAIREKIHFEMCPISSVLTGSSPRLQNPIHQIATSGAQFSISTDDPTMNDASLSHDYEFCSLFLGLPHQLLTLSNFMALDAAFIPEEEKNEIRKRLVAAYTQPSIPPR